MTEVGSSHQVDIGGDTLWNATNTREIGKKETGEIRMWRNSNGASISYATEWEVKGREYKTNN